MKISDILIRIIFIILISVAYHRILTGLQETNDLITVIKLFGAYFITTTQIFICFYLVK